MRLDCVLNGKNYAVMHILRPYIMLQSAHAKGMAVWTHSGLCYALVGCRGGSFSQ